MLFSTAATGEGLSQRYELKLALKRMDEVTGEKGYAGAVLVCSAGYEPIAGHRASTPFVKYLSEGRKMEITLANRRQDGPDGTRDRRVLMQR